MVDIALRGELWDNDSADILRWWGWRDITAPMDIQAALDAAGGDEVTLLINSPGGDMTVGTEIRSMLRRYPGKTTALFQGYGASAATLAATGCKVIQSEPGALLCYHNPSGEAEGDYHDMRRSAESLRNARDCVLEVYAAHSSFKSREELIALMEKNIWISPSQALTQAFEVEKSVAGISLKMENRFSGMFPKAAVLMSNTMNQAKPITAFTSAERRTP